MKKPTPVIYHRNSEMPDDIRIFFDTPFYKRDSRGAGYKKYSIERLSVTFNNILCVLKGHHNGAFIFENFKIIDNHLKPKRDKVIFASAGEYFLYMESSNALHKRYIKSTEQYQLELQHQQTKYPELFL